MAAAVHARLQVNFIARPRRRERRRKLAGRGYDSHHRDRLATVDSCEERNEESANAPLSRCHFSASCSACIIPAHNKSRERPASCNRAILDAFLHDHLGSGMSELPLILCIFAAAVLYSSVGHGGASAYLAAMAFFNVAPETMRPASLTLNIFVATIGAVRFYRAGCFSWSILLPFAVASVPAAFIGGWLTLPGKAYKIVVGIVMLTAAARFAWKPVADTSKPIPLPIALLCGTGIGLISGLTGTGGGIFLSPLLLVMGWAETKQSSGVCAAFILVNSIAGIIGLLTKPVTFPAMLPLWVVAAVAGGLIGSGLGATRLSNPTLRRLLAVVLVIAAMKLLLT